MHPREHTPPLPSSEHSPLPLPNALSLQTPSNNLAPDLNDNSPQTRLQAQAGDPCRHGASPSDSSRPTLLPTPRDSTHPHHHGLWQVVVPGPGPGPAVVGHHEGSTQTGALRPAHPAVVGHPGGSTQETWPLRPAHQARRTTGASTSSPASAGHLEQTRSILPTIMEAAAVSRRRRPRTQATSHTSRRTRRTRLRSQKPARRTERSISMIDYLFGDVLCPGVWIFRICTLQISP